jgi:hypothetical protein
VPDLTGVAGWNASWGLLNGTAISWSVSAMGGANYLLDATVADGATMRGAQRSGGPLAP